MTKDEALKLALEFVEETEEGTADLEALINEALAQPPQRPWVELPHEDILDLFDEHNVYGSKWLGFARAVLAKSKERNA